jgi:hypothetical protein
VTVLRSGYVVADGWAARDMANVKAERREDRLKAALRENLKRRKAQTRGRDEAGHDAAAVGGEGQGTPGAPKDRAE